jgi:phosphomannomutase/phosphoglucomutase
MKLIFGALTIFTALMIAIAGFGVLGLTTSTLEKAKQESVAALATGLAYSISSQMLLFEQTVNQMAMDEDVIAAIESGDPALIEKTADKVQKFLPLALKVRLLLPTVNQIDKQASPAMGYADLEMVKKTLTAKQPSIIQGEGNDRHLAITASIKKDNQVIGVVLASLRFNFLQEILTKAPINDNFIEISQETVALSSAGDASIKNHSPVQTSIANSPWQISYATANTHDFSSIGIIIGLIISLAVLGCGASFCSYYFITVLLKGDQDKVLEAVKDLMTGKELGGYEAKLSEMQVIIATLLQFKRILDNKHNKAGDTSVNLDDDDLFADDIENDLTAEKLAGSSLFKKKNQLNR